MSYKKKRIKFELILSAIVLIFSIILIILIFLITIKRPEKFTEFNLDDIPILSLESFDFIEDKTILEYPNDNLGITGKLILDCHTGICTLNIIHNKKYHFCNFHYFSTFCYDMNENLIEPNEIIDHSCSEQCHETGNDECKCNEPYNEKGKCQRKMDDKYKEGKVCYDYNTIHFWKGKKYTILKKNFFSYQENAILKDEECPIGTKNCGIIDDNGNQLCIEKNLNCPINFLYENKLDNDNDFSSVLIGNKTFYYGFDDNKKRKIIAGLVANTDLLLNKDNDNENIIDNYTISGFLEDNQNLYKDVNLGYDPYKENNIDFKGKSYLRIFYNDNINLSLLRERKEEQISISRINKEIINIIRNKTKIISILGLISLFYLFLIFICIISYQCNYYKNGSDKGSKCCYFWGIIIFIGLIITPLIYSCNIISKVKYAKEKYGYNDIFSTFKILNMIFVILGFALILFLIVYIILVPFKFCFKENKGNETHENKTSFSTENIK